MASKTALAIAGAVGTSGGSPMPLAPVGFASGSGRSAATCAIERDVHHRRHLVVLEVGVSDDAAAASTTRSSLKAKPRPWVTPPTTWLSTMVGLTIRPQSWDGHDTQHGDLARLDVHLDLDALGAEGAYRLVRGVRAPGAVPLDHVRGDLPVTSATAVGRPLALDQDLAPLHP